MHDTVEKKEFYYLIGWMEQSQEALRSFFYPSMDLAKLALNAS